MSLTRALVIDDEPLVRRSLERVLQLSGFEVMQAADGLLGLQMWLEHRPDVVLLDVLMPGLSGPQVLEKVPQELKAQTKIMMMSAFTGEFTQTKAHELGAQLFVAKPFDDIFEVVKKVKSLLGEEAP